jgi:serine/threonine protein kinase
VFAPRRDVAVKQIFLAAADVAKLEVKLFDYDHPNVAKIFGYYKEPAVSRHVTLNLVMEKGVGSLKFLYESAPPPTRPSSDSFGFGKMQETQFFWILTDISQGLAYLHSHGIIHHDVCADNIIQTENRLFKLIDMCSITMAGTAGTNGGGRGHPNWVEDDVILCHSRALKSTDVFSFGKLIMYLLHGRVNMEIDECCLSQVLSCDVAAPEMRALP